MTDIEQDEILLGDLLWALLRDWLLIGGMTAVFFAAAVGVALWLPDEFESEAVLARASATDDGFDAVSDRLGDLGGLAALALPGGGSDAEEAIALAILQSRAFIAAFIERHDLLAAVTVVESWDEESGTLYYDPSRFEAKTGRWLPDDEARPSAQQAVAAFQKRFEVSEDPRTGMLTVIVRHESAVLAQQMVEWLINDINAQLRSRAIAETQRSIGYLREEIEGNSVAALDTLLYGLIQSQTERLVLARARPEYAFRVIDPPLVAEAPATPRRLLIAFLGLVLGGAFGVSLSLARNFLLPRLRTTNATAASPS